MGRFVMPVIALLLLVGCVGQSPGDLDPNPDSPPMAGTPVAGESAALGLVNLWRVHGADGEDHPTWLRLDAWDFQLWRDCGMIMGSWRATESLFLADANSASGDCASSGMPTVAWLADATEFVPTSDGYDLLLGASGATVASLTIDGAPEPIPTAAEFYTEPPEITEEVRQHSTRPRSCQTDCCLRQRLRSKASGSRWHTQFRRIRTSPSARPEPGRGLMAAME